jgi:hypothetical protein
MDAKLNSMTSLREGLFFYGLESFVMHLTDSCRFLNCSVRMGVGGGGVEGFIMNSEGVRYES